MSLANKPLDTITEDDLQELIDNQVQEGKEYDYKLQMNYTDDDKREFLADASSFANTVGGYLIIGMDEAGGIPTAIRGLQEDEDALKLRLEEILRNGLAPRIRFEIQPVPVEAGNVFVIRIPQSWTAPHMVTYKNYSRFYARHSAGKYQLDVSELRSAFTLSASTTERIRNFRLDRIAKIVADETPFRLNAGAKLVLHVVPVGTFISTVDFSSLSLDKLYDWKSKFSQPIVITDYSYNLDGVLFYGESVDTHMEEHYIQIFRNGAIEYVNKGRLRRKLIPNPSYEQTLIELLPIFLYVQDQLGFQPSSIVMLSLLGVGDYAMDVSSWDAAYNSGQTVDRDNLLIPDFMIENLDGDFASKLKPVFDVVWNSCGWRGSMNYDENGKWKHPR